MHATAIAPPPTDAPSARAKNRTRTILNRRRKLDAPVPLRRAAPGTWHLAAHVAACNRRSPPLCPPVSLCLARCCRVAWLPRSPSQSPSGQGRSAAAPPRRAALVRPLLRTRDQNEQCRCERQARPSRDLARAPGQPARFHESGAPPPPQPRHLSFRAGALPQTPPRARPQAARTRVLYELGIGNVGLCVVGRV